MKYNQEKYIKTNVIEFVIINKITKNVIQTELDQTNLVKLITN